MKTVHRLEDFWLGKVVSENLDGSVKRMRHPWLVMPQSIDMLYYLEHWFSHGKEDTATQYTRELRRLDSEFGKHLKSLHADYDRDYMQKALAWHRDLRRVVDERYINSLIICDMADWLKKRGKLELCFSKESWADREAEGYEWPPKTLPMSKNVHPRKFGLIQSDPHLNQPDVDAINLQDLKAGIDKFNKTKKSKWSIFK